MVIVGPARWVPCDIRGDFAIAGSTLGESIRVESAGYASKTLKVVELDPNGSIEVLLDPLRDSAVIVEDGGGSRLQGVIVEWRAAVDPVTARTPSLTSGWIIAREHVSGDTVTKTTDSDGVSRLALSRAAMAAVHDPKSSAVMTVMVAPGAEVLVRMPSEPTRLQFVDDATGAPVPGMEIESWSSSEISSRASLAVTDRNGVVELLPSSYPVLVRRPGGANVSDDMIPASPGITRRRKGYIGRSLVVEAGLEGGLGQIRLRRAGAQLLLLDARSGLPIDARVWMDTARQDDCPETAAEASGCSSHTPRKGDRNEETTFMCRDGLLPVPDYILRKLEATPAHDRIQLCAPGYAPARVPVDAFPLRQVGFVYPVHLEPARPRSLRVRYANGDAYRGTVWVHAPRGNVRLWHDYGKVDGLHGPFDWSGGDLQVGFGDRPAPDHVIPATQLTPAEVIELQLPVRTGAIEVHGIPPDYAASSLRAKLGLTSDAALYRPGSGGDGRCRFESLPCGSYAVGPEWWIRAVELKMLEFRADGREEEIAGTRRLVEEGATTTVAWNPDWASQIRVEGRVRAPSYTEGRLFLLPDFGPATLDRKEIALGMPRAIMSRRREQIAMDRDGRYVIEVGDPMPRTIAVCLSYSGGDDWGTLLSFQVVETIKPGESIELQLGSLRLVRPDSQLPAEVRVSLQMAPTSLRYPLSTAFTGRTCAWAGEGPLVLDGIPLSIDHVSVGVVGLESLQNPIRLEAGKKVFTDQLPIRLEAGREVTVEWNPAGKGSPTDPK
jgi:hypothetical protein